MSLKSRVGVLEAKQVQAAQDGSSNEAVMGRWQYLLHQQRECDNSLARFIGGPAGTYIESHGDRAPAFALTELFRCGCLCGQTFLRLTAQNWEMVLNDFGLPGKSPFKAEEIEEARQAYLAQAQMLDDAGVPDMSIVGRKIPYAVGSTWLDRLAWAMALGDQLETELGKANWWDTDPVSMRNAKVMQGGALVVYQSPLSEVPSLPDWMMAGLIENPYPCEPYVFNNGPQTDCP